MTEITSSEELKEWLKGQDKQISVAIAARIALRLIPIFDKAVVYEDKDAMILPLLRAMSISWFGGIELSKDIMELAIDAAPSASFANAVFALAMKPNVDADNIFVYAFSKNVVASLAAGTADAALAALSYRSSDVIVSNVWQEISYDVTFLEEDNAVGALIERPLFLGEMDSKLKKRWQSMKEALLNLDENWQVWTNWYEDRLVGGPRPNGRLVIEALERERVLIPDEDWNKGAAHVNALIAEMEKRYQVPEPPVQRLAEIMLQVGEDHKVHIQPHPLTTRDAAQDKRWHDAWDGLRDALEDFVHYVPEGNNRALDRAVQRYQEALSSHFENMNVIKLGQTGNRLSELLQRAKDELMDDVAAELAALLVNHNDFIKQVPEWRNYQKDADTGVAKSDVDFAREVVNQLDDQGDLLDDDVIEEFKTYADFLFDDYVPQEDDKAVVSDPVVVDFVRSVGNLLSVVAKPVVDCARKVRAGVDALNRKAFEWRAQRFLIQLEDMGLMDMLIAYAGSSREFAWLAPIIAYVRGKMRD
ncbi:hypothetical protein GCM10011332_12400 [Terasakiella brassicae]|uniref:Uncharacterized protein n=1 Tax=Terasakiella brassicae TaxID=1634917 RepID=A0A917FBQ6_9PROT|nr:hypothetical protein [Terasakiella brassicae]GGF60216.1 hypothetical protein GCM10011332_12400 [Terasakiella brassicae]